MKETIVIIVEINESENKKTEEKNQWSLSWLSDKKQKQRKPLAILTKNMREKTQWLKQGMKW